MNRNYATLFDSKYLSRGLALYQSLMRHKTEAFTLHVLAMDREVFWLLDSMDLPNIRVTPLESFETAMHMEPVRNSRSWKEYCWTAASSFMEYLMPAHDLPELTYLDADLFFFADPRIVFDEIGSRSIVIVPHRFSESDRSRLEKNGKYNVGWITFRNTASGRACLRKWAAETREWCFHRNEGGKFGDQAYLDHFEADFGSDVAVIQNIGVGVAPWNLQQYRVGQEPSVNGSPVVFYHFHEFKSASELTNYPLRSADIEFIYVPYIRMLGEMDVMIAKATRAREERQAAMAEQALRA